MSIEAGYTPSTRVTDPVLRDELYRIAEALRLGRVGMLRLDMLDRLPPRPGIGDMAVFAAGVVSPNSDQGLYEYTEQGGNTIWRKL